LHVVQINLIVTFNFNYRGTVSVYLFFLPTHKPCMFYCDIAADELTTAVSSVLSAEISSTDSISTDVLLLVGCIVIVLVVSMLLFVTLRLQRQCSLPQQERYLF